jgi:hypothetical protein
LPDARLQSAAQVRLGSSDIPAFLKKLVGRRERQCSEIIESFGDQCQAIANYSPAYT